MEIDCHSKKALMKIGKQLGLYPKYYVENFNIGDYYFNNYGIKKKRKLGVLTFKDAKKQLGQYIKKNNKEFNLLAKIIRSYR